MFTFSTWGMSGTIATADPDAEPFARERLAHWLEEFDGTVNRFISTSELSRRNRGEWTDVAMSSTFDMVFSAATYASQITDGLCDPTILPALEALGYDRDYDELARDGSRGGATPSPAAGVAAIQRGPEGLLTLPPGVRLDFGATAKAILCDILVSELAPSGGVLVEVGGDVAVHGEGPTGPFVIGLATSLTITGKEPRITLSGGGVATSSRSTRVWRSGDDTVNHIIDPRSGECVHGSLAVATVAAPNCVTANAFATAALVWDDMAAYHIAQAGHAARLVHEDGRVEFVGGWDRSEVAA